MIEKKPYMDSVAIMKRIPHRYPFLLVDRVDSFEHGPDPKKREGRKVIARKNVTFNEAFFQGHFPHAPVMPGVLMVEAMAQAGALACVAGEDENLDVRIAKIEEARFRRPIVPGDTLEMHTLVVKEKGGLICVSGKTYCDEELVAEVIIWAKIISISKG